MQEDAGGYRRCRRMPEGTDVQKSAEEYRRMQRWVQRRSVQRVQGGAGGYIETQEDQKVTGRRRGVQEGSEGEEGYRRVLKGSRGEEWCRRQKRKYNCKVKMTRRRLTSGFHAKRRE